MVAESRVHLMVVALAEPETLEQMEARWDAGGL